jgi:hypothetical protein
MNFLQKLKKALQLKGYTLAGDTVDATPCSALFPC